MKNQKSRLFKRVLVPIVHGCEQASANTVARTITDEDNIMLLGLIYIPEANLSAPPPCAPVKSARP